jgi:hypothetical protein
MQTLEICKHNLCGFFNVVNQLQICDNEDFTLDSIYKERERFSLVTNLNILPSKVIWILCEIVRIAEDRSLIIRPGFANNEEIQGLEDYEVIIDDETNRKLVCADCADLQDLKLPFMAHKSSSGVIGIAYIQIKMLKAQLILMPLATILAAAMAKCCANSALTISIDGTAIIMLGRRPACCGAACACGAKDFGIC